MIRIRVKQLLDDKSFRERRRIPIEEVIQATGISRSTMTRILNKPGFSISTDMVDELCKYFECQPGELLKFVSE